MGCWLKALCRLFEIGGAFAPLAGFFRGLNGCPTPTGPLSVRLVGLQQPTAATDRQPGASVCAHGRACMCLLPADAVDMGKLKLPRFSEYDVSAGRAGLLAACRACTASLLSPLPALLRCLVQDLRNSLCNSTAEEGAAQLDAAFRAGGEQAQAAFAVGALAYCPDGRNGAITSAFNGQTLGKEAMRCELGASAFSGSSTTIVPAAPSLHRARLHAPCINTLPPACPRLPCSGYKSMQQAAEAIGWALCRDFVVTDSDITVVDSERLTAGRRSAVGGDSVLWRTMAWPRRPCQRWNSTQQAWEDDPASPALGACKGRKQGLPSRSETGRPCLLPLPLLPSC